ncbi:MAG TPA: hypothetical protein VJR89_30540, partial [Polyangiales bacterium]|nr:hypothetical protein [Polyangiales bacterium]
HWVAGRPHKYAEISEQILERISQPGDGGLDAVQHRRTRLGLIYGLGLMEAGTGSTRAETRAALLEHERDYRVSAWRIRMLMHLKQGNLDEAQRCERRAELLFLQEHGVRSYESMGAGAEVAARAEAGDLLGVKSSVETLAILAGRHTGWRPAYLGGLSRYRSLHGDLEGALEAIVSGVALAPPGRHNAFSPLAAGHVRTLLDLGRIDEAVACAKHYLAVCEREELSMYREVLNANVAAALASAGEYAAAIELIESSIAAAEDGERVGLALGSLYEHRARIAIAMRDAEAFASAAERCAAEYAKAKNPALSARFARLLEDACQHEVSEADAAAEYRELLPPSAAESEYNTVHSRMLECVDAGDRARCALSLLLSSTESNAGYLFAVRERRVVLLAALPEQLADAELRDWVDECVQSALGSDEIVTAESTGDGTLSTGLLRYTDADGQAFQPVFLLAGPEREAEMAAVLVVQVRPGVRCVPSNTLLRELARELLEHGDVSAVQLAAARLG